MKKFKITTSVGESTVQAEDFECIDGALKIYSEGKLCAAFAAGCWQNVVTIAIEQ